MNQTAEPTASTAKSGTEIPFPHTFRELLRQAFGNGASAHPTIQFCKYVVVGGLSTLVQMVVMYAILGWVFPGMRESDPVFQLLTACGLSPQVPASEAARAWNASLGWGIGFYVSIVFCYFMNCAFVFVPGKLPRWLEFVLFVTSGTIAFLLGVGVLNLLILLFGGETTYGVLINMITSTMVNYAARKFLIFKG